MTNEERRYYTDIHKIASCLGAIQKTLERIERNTRPVELEPVMATLETAHDDDLK
jgi:hypothetical protein